MRRIFLYIIMSALVGSAKAQTVISGHVADSLGQPVQAFVTLAEAGATMTSAFADADETGFFRLEYDGTADSLVVRASDMTFGTLVRRIANRTQTVDFRARGSFELKEVIVKAEKICESGDTLSYNVAAYRGEEDRVIGDVLRKMPGIEVADNGSIKFNGKEIKNFYVEDMNLLQGRYGLATNNISAQDVTVVQVLQNHQPIRALKDLRPTDDVSINLKLRKEAKGTWAVTGMVGSGAAPLNPPKGGKQGRILSSGEQNIPSSHPPFGGNEGGFLWAGELISMYFGKTKQNMTTWKGNNAGNDVSAEVVQHGGGSGLLFAGVPLSVQQPSSPGLAAKRFVGNRSHVASANQIFKLDSVSNIVFNAVYQNEQLTRQGESMSEYYLAQGGRLRIGESVRTVSRVNRLEVSSKYEFNAAKSYVTDNVQLNVGWDSAESPTATFASGEGVEGFSQTVLQRLKTPNLTVTNDFRLLRNLGDRSYNIDFLAGFDQKPFELSVNETDQSPSLEGEQGPKEDCPLAIRAAERGAICDCDGGQRAGERLQTYTARTIAARLNTSYGFRFGKLCLDYILSGDVNLQNIGSELYGIFSEAEDNRNDFSFNKYALSLDQFARLDLDRWYFSLSTALSGEAQQLDDRAFGTDRTWSYVFLRPTAEATYILGSSWFKLTSSYYHIVDNGQRAARGTVMHNYRSLQRSLIDDASRQQTANSSLSFYHKNTHRQFFLNASASWLHSHSASVTGIDYDGAQTICRVQPFDHNYDNIRASAETSKGFDLWRSNVKLVGNYGLTRTKQLIQQQPTDVRTDYWSASAYLVASPVRWLSLAAAYAFGQSVSKTTSPTSGEEGRGLNPKMNTSTTRLDINILPVPRLILNLAAEDNYNNMTATNRHAWFGDAKIKYKTRALDYELELNNLFNQRQYTRTTYSGPDIFTTTTHLRPLNVLLKVRFKLL